MMISPAVGDPYTAAAALDRPRRSQDGDSRRSPSDSDAAASPDSGPDVVVTLGQGSSSAPAYGPSGRFSGRPSLEDMGANAPDSLAHATESSRDEDEDNSSTDTTADATSASPDADDGSADEEATVAA